MPHYYNILSKSDKGNRANHIYKFLYQVDNKPQVYSAQLLCFGSENRQGKFAYLSTNTYELIESEENRDNFINEIKLFQKGKCYRLSHPVAKSERDNLQSALDEAEKVRQKCSQALREYDLKMLSEKINEYRTSKIPSNIKEVMAEYKNLLDRSMYTIRFETNRYILHKQVFTVYTKSDNNPVYLLLIDTDTSEVTVSPVTDDIIADYLKKFN